MKTRSGYSGDMLLAYKGVCETCGHERTLYFAECRQDIRRQMLYGMEDYSGNCQNCLMNGVFDTIKRWYQIPHFQADKELAIIGRGGIDIDFDAAERDAKDNEANDRWLENNEGRVEEYKAWKKKKLP